MGLKAWPRPESSGLRCSLDFARNDAIQRFVDSNRAKKSSNNES